MGQLTRTEMEDVIKGGGGVLYKGQTLTRLEQLPSAADLAQGDPEAETAVANALQAQIAALQAQLDSLARSGQSPTISPPRAQATEEPKTEEPKTEEPKAEEPKAAKGSKG